MTSPYDGLGPDAFWRSAVAPGDPATDGALYRPRHPITPDTAIFTAGSCFAQHVTAALRRAGCHVIDAEPLQARIDPGVARAFGYGLYSARFGNIYTLRQLRQLVEEVLGRRQPACPVWTRDGACFDALRPSVEPAGLGSADLVAEARAQHLQAVRRGLEQAGVLIFTLGLTECWEHRETGTVYPTAPETLAGRFDPDIFAFRNLSYADCIDDFLALREMLAEINPGLTYVLTVSPVPLTATASGGHVLAASTRSKAVLRAVCGALYDADPGVDYFPSFELITTPRAGGHWFQENLRSVSAEGVAMVMRHFLTAHGLKAEVGPDTGPDSEETDAAEPLCDEILLEAFAK